ncbi:protein-S-isoprenylcysteine O-methyltransferase [Bryocella elongata]|uniref:Protein-S-isoprenylcysteine O-methyltransferase n=1 Tax=Bryocella elongata TaxID=863522 RepID=A0A1H6BLM9_9BACT|nr:isoprenylcysteine carboxylmethyltransferase family protein [Bryocella elongata]SEG61631.1 protein-S-isoprenylcysteine O-methyltransferase [Bryocella elongata]
MTSSFDWFRLAWRTLYWAWIASEILLVLMTYTRRSGGEVKDQGSMRLLWVVIFASISLGTWFSATHEAEGAFGLMPGGPHAVRGVALAMLAFGLTLRWVAIYTLGRAFSVNVAIRDGQRVMRAGLFGYMRHPSYTGLLLCIAALGVRSGNWIGLAIIVAPTTAALLYRISVEEAALRTAFGEEYVAYSAETKRLIPGIY